MASPNRPSTPQGTTVIQKNPTAGALSIAGNLSENHSPRPATPVTQTSAAQVSDRKRSALTKGVKSEVKKKRQRGRRDLPPSLLDTVPELKGYLDLVDFENKLDFTIMRKRMSIQESLKKPLKQRRKLRIFISNTFFPGKIPTNDNEEPIVPSWELRVEGRLLDEHISGKLDKNKRKFSSFFKSLVIELDKNYYGPDNHLVEWHRTPSTTETDGFQVKRPGDKNVKCTILLLLDYQPLQYKLDSRLARLLGIHTQTKPVVIASLWEYVKTHKLQDSAEKEYINCNKCLEQIFKCQRFKFSEIPLRINQLLHPADPVVINHLINTDGAESKKTSCYDIDVEVDDPIKSMMSQFLQNTTSQPDIQALDLKLQETVDVICDLNDGLEFYSHFALNSQDFLDFLVVSQTRDYQTMVDVANNPEDERHADYFYSSWAQEAVCRYFYSKVQQRRTELEQALGIRNS